MRLPEKNQFTKHNIELHPAADFEAMRRAGKLAAETLDMIEDHVKVGVTTEELDKLCFDFITKHGAIPAPLGYKGYPKSICTSINHVVCHGIPSPEDKLKEGDIINIDVTVIVDGWHGDTSRMYIVGKTSVMRQRLVKITYECLMKGIEQVKPGNTLGDIAHAIQNHAEKERFSVVRDFCGHGLGKNNEKGEGGFHAPPSVLHYYEEHLDNVVLEPGMFFTIEPMINEGTFETMVKKTRRLNGKEIEDGWTAITRDKKASAQYEHTIAVTETGYEIFTLSPRHGT